MGFQTRPRQTAFIDAIRLELQAGAHAVLGQAPTGFGKTVIASYMLGTSAQRGTPSLFLVHRRELIKQTIEAFATVGIDHGVIAAGFEENPRPLVQLASVGSYIRRRARLRRPGLVVWDECHHVVAESWSAIFKDLSSARHVGLTATPQRLDGTGLGGHFQKMVQGPSVATLIEEGWLSPYQLFMPEGISLAGVHTRMGDYVKSELAAAVDRPTVTGDAIREYNDHCYGARALAFCATIEHSQHVAAQFNANGIPAAHVDGETPIEERDAVIEAFKRGETRVLCNVDLFGEGFDLPACEAVILLRPTRSLALHLQWIGRGLRTAPGKKFVVILDHAGNCGRHGLPDEDWAWSLDGPARRLSAEQSDGRPLLKKCRVCKGVAPRSAKTCKVCSNNFALGGGRPDVQYVSGKLAAVDAPAIRQSHREEVYAADSLAKLIELGRRKKYKDPEGWATHVFAARQRRKEERARGL